MAADVTQKPNQTPVAEKASGVVSVNGTAIMRSPLAYTAVFDSSTIAQTFGGWRYSGIGKVEPAVTTNATTTYVLSSGVPIEQCQAISGMLGTTMTHVQQIDAVLDVIKRRRQTNEGEEGLPWSGRVGFLERATRLTLAGEELVFTFPGFPFKSANTQSKVLGHLPDEAERLSIRNLSEMMDEMSEMYAGGCRLVIASDGLPFNQLFRVSDEDTIAYYESMQELIKGTRITMVSMLDLIPEGNTLAEKRAFFEAAFARSPEVINALIENDAETNEYYRGLKHFLKGDLGPIWIKEIEAAGETISNREIERRCGFTARDFIRLNEAYNKLVAERMPPSIRLSVHPQAADNPSKVGIELMFGEMRKAWGTPWQCALVQLKDGTWDLTRKNKAMQAGYQVVNDEKGNPSHYVEV